MEEEKVKTYKDETEYLNDCFRAVLGTANDKNYLSKDFENIIGAETPTQWVCTFLTTHIKEKGSDWKQYCTPLVISDSSPFTREETIAAATDVLTKLDSEIAKTWIPEPSALYDKLKNARKKLNLAKDLRQVANKTAGDNPISSVAWTQNYCDEVTHNITDTIDSFELDDQKQGRLLIGGELTADYKEIIKGREVASNRRRFHNKIFDELITEGPSVGHGGIIGGSTGMGKSTLCLNVINDMLNADVPCIYFPIEMGKENTLDRLAAMRTKIPFKTLQDLCKDPEARKVVEHEMEALKLHDRFAIVDDPVITLKKLRNYILEFQKKTGCTYCVVLIDLLLQIQEFYNDGSGNMATDIERAITKLDILAKELGFHWVGVVQLNKSVESEKVMSLQSIDKLKPTRSAIKNSSALLERARWAITIFRKKYFADLYLSEEEASSIEDIAEIQLMKANDEEIARRYMQFDGPTFSMTPVETANGF